MLARRRRANPTANAAGASAPSAAGHNSAGASTGGGGGGGGPSASSAPPHDGAGTSGGAGAHTANALIEERLAAFAPLHLPPLVTDNDLEEAVGSSGDITMYDASFRQRFRITQGLLFMYLHIGSDPPDFQRVEPCARMECWTDPMVAHVSQYAPHGGGGGSDSIAETLSQQYRSVLKEDTPIHRLTEASVDASRSALIKARRMARDGRVLVHYNGHGMPRATELGELWMFDKERAHYVPLNITEMAELVESPTMYILDCNCAGNVLRRWYKDNMQEKRPHDLFICACGPGETLPLSPNLPADVLTACLTTPLRMALEWYIGFSHHRVLLPQVTDDMIRSMPGDMADRKSMRGELGWILSAVTDTIAWCVLPPTQFHYMYRHDTATRSLFRNAILADRLLREAGCTPVTHPPLPEETHLHAMWDTWEYTLEKAISQLTTLMSPEHNAVYASSSFFDDQLTAFEVWVESGDVSQVPEQLPSVLLALGQYMYRVRAFTLLAKYLDSGRTAGKRAILCGILPYISKLLVQAPEVFLIVTVLWMQVIRADPIEGCSEVQRSQCEKYFTSLLKLDESLTRIEQVDYGQSVSAYNASRGRSLSQTDGSPMTATASTSGVTSNFASPPLFMSDHTRTLRHLNPLSTLSLDGASESADAAVGSGRASSIPARHTGATPSPHVAQPPPSPPGSQQQQQPGIQLNSIATHAVQPGSTTYYLLKDIDLSRCKSMTCYILCQFMLRGERQCVLCWNNRLLNAVYPCLSSPSAELRSWASLTLSKLFAGLRYARSFASKECASRVGLFTGLLRDRSPIVRSSGVTLVASIVGIRVDLLPQDQQVRRIQAEKSLLIQLREYLFDASMNVREELIFFACQVLYAYRSALPAEVDGDLVRYIREIDERGPNSTWVLEEPDVQVRSQLNASRPTVNALFDDAVTFETALITGDDPLPHSRTMDLTKVDPKALEIVSGLLHDAAKMLCTLGANCDHANVTKAVRALGSGSEPRSQRFALEALRTMSRVASVDSAAYLSEADRGRWTTNWDSMQQLVLDMRARKLEPHRPSVLPEEPIDGQSSSPPPASQAQPQQGQLRTNGTAGQAMGRGSLSNGGARSHRTDAGYHLSRCLVLPSTLRSDTVVCTAFRTLDASLVVATKNQKISYVSYDSYNSQVMLNSFSPRLAGPIHELRVINDLSEQSGLLIVTKRGDFSLMKGCWDPDTVPTEVALFSACPPPPPNTWLDIKTTYRSSTGTLYSGGPIGPGGSTQIHALSLAEEQVTQRLEVSSNPTLTCLAAHTTMRALLAGFGDGVVRYYDDRQKQGQVGTVGMAQCVGESSATGAVDAVLGVGPVAMAAGFTMAAATRRAMFLFDSRKLTEPLLEVSAAKLLAVPDEDNSFASASPPVAPGSGPSPFITNCSVGVHTGLIGLSFSDSSYAAYNTKGQLLSDRPSHVMSRDTSPGPILPCSCVVHPLRPLMAYGGDLLFLQL